MSIPRYQGVDATRGLAMVLMTTTHALRALRPDVPPEFGQWLMRIEPIIPTLFFMVAGWSLARSKHRSSGSAGWGWRHGRRALGLWILSVALFFSYSGPQWPEILTSTGVLQCLAIAILVGICLNDAWKAAFGALATGGAFVWMDAHGIRVDGINNGSFPLFPFLPIFLASFAIERPMRQRSWLQPVVATAGGALILLLSAKFGFRNLWGEWGMTNTFQEYVRTPGSGYNGFALTRDLLNGVQGESYMVSFWSTLPRLVPVVVAMSGLAALFLCAVADRFPARLQVLSLIGRHSLPYYVGHLALLGALGLVLPASIRGLPWSWFVASAIAVGLGVAWSTWRESRGVKP